MVAAVVTDGGRGRLRVLREDGRPEQPAEAVDDLVAEIGRRDGEGVRWLWGSTAEVYPALLANGRRVGRCHDAELTEALLLGYDGRWGEPRSVAASWARRHGRPVPPDPVPDAPVGAGGAGDQVALFETPKQAPMIDADPLDALVETYAAQHAAIAARPEPGRFRLLVAAENAGALIAAEMGHVGLPWSGRAHDDVLRELLGDPPSIAGAPPSRLVELTTTLRELFHDPRLHPESPAEVLRAFSRAGIVLPSTRAWVLKSVDHPAVAPLLEFKELYRIWTAHGWSWRATWVRDGRFHPEYVPAGVVSGRWATRGGGALQIPKAVRRAVVADPGWAFVVADAGQLEPRVLAAMAGDNGLARAGAGGDLYAALAAEAFATDRAQAKLALLGAMYGQTGGNAVPALAALRQRFPVAWDYVERAARAGEAGGLVRSWLGRTCPPPGPEERTPARERARGRFTRNFVIQATAAEWALTLLALVRTALPADAELVFFQHDEVIVHCPREHAAATADALREAAERASRLLFGATPVRFPLGVAIVDCYADAK
ncbi:bifunctional 3'-5' exonuclease/DNA polymerase [Luedemannella flava]|uniref:bifunctional 3'-5' exonuclease/DNA polymerase n=1 Tax=Luedemannella flava TaxID=349316 RepID=UPI003CD09118